MIDAKFTPDGTRLITTGSSENTGKRERKVVVWAVTDGAEK